MNYAIHYTKKGILNLPEPYSDWMSHEHTLAVLCDADFSGCPFSRRSTSGWIAYYWGNVISFGTIKQKSNATSSTVAEVLALLETMKEICWTVDLLKDLRLDPEEIYLFCDSKPAIEQCKHPTQHRNTRHYENTLFFLRQSLTDLKINLEHIATDYNVADFLTKPLERTRFNKLLTNVFVNKKV